MKRYILFSVMLAGALFLIPCQGITAMTQYKPFDPEKSYFNQLLPSESTYEQMNTVTPFAPPSGGGGIDQGGDEGTEDPKGSENDAHIADGLMLLAIMAAAYALLMSRRKIKIRSRQMYHIN